MKYDIILSGVGGQGILSIAAVIAAAAMGQGLVIRQSEVHGMAQRGGGVQAHLRLSDSAISSNLIGRGRADMILGMEPLECLRQVDYLGPTGVLIISAEPYRNIPDYPEDEELKQLLAQVGNSHLVPTEKLARQAGSVRTANMVLIGVASPFLPVNTDSIEKAVRLIFASKGEEAIENNLRAMRLGMQR